MRRAYALLFLLLAACACESGPRGVSSTSSLPADGFAGPKPALTLPSDLAGFAKLGVAVPVDSVLAEGKEGLQFEENAFRSTVRAKFYAPGEPAAVANLVKAGLVGASEGGGVDEKRIVGKTKEGDEVEIMLGPGGNRDKTMVMVYVTRVK